MSQSGSEQQELQLVIFGLGDEHYGVDISTVQEIINGQAVTRIPKTPEFVEGIITLRGNVIPVIDLRKRFGLGQEVVGNQTRIVVVEVDRTVVGMVVDSVSEVIRVPVNHIAPSAIVSGLETNFIRGVVRAEGQLVILVEPGPILAWYEQRTVATKDNRGGGCPQANCVRTARGCTRVQRGRPGG